MGLPLSTKPHSVVLRMGSTADLLSTAELLQALQVNCIPLYGILAPGLYRFTVQVSAEDTLPPEPIQVLIRWDGTWDSLRPA
jgi:hypothetical protein